MAWVALLMVTAVFAVTILSCISDIRSLRIPNLYSVIIIACFLPAWFAAPKGVFEPFWHHITAMLIMFILSYGMFYKGMMGGGDSKLATALSFWVGLKGLIPFIFYMALMGGAVGVATLVFQKKKLFSNPTPGSWVEQAQAGQNAIPYGIAISFGSWIVLFHTALTLH